MIFNNPKEAMDFYGQNLDWENSPTQAKNALMALRYLQANRPQSSAHLGSSLTFSDISNLIKRIEEITQEKNRISWTVARPRFL